MAYEDPIKQGNDGTPPSRGNLLNGAANVKNNQFSLGVGYSSQNYQSRQHMGSGLVDYHAAVYPYDPKYNYSDHYTMSMTSGWSHGSLAQTTDNLKVSTPTINFSYHGSFSHNNASIRTGFMVAGELPLANLNKTVDYKTSIEPQSVTFLSPQTGPVGTPLAREAGQVFATDNPLLSKQNPTMTVNTEKFRGYAGLIAETNNYGLNAGIGAGAVFSKDNTFHANPTLNASVSYDVSRTVKVTLSAYGVFDFNNRKPLEQEKLGGAFEAQQQGYYNIAKTETNAFLKQIWNKMLDMEKKFESDPSHPTADYYSPTIVAGNMKQFNDLTPELNKKALSQLGVNLGFSAKISDRLGIEGNIGFSPQSASGSKITSESAKLFNMSYVVDDKSDYKPRENYGANVTSFKENLSNAVHGSLKATFNIGHKKRPTDCPDLP